MEDKETRTVGEGRTALEVVTIEVGALAANCYLIICPQTHDALVVDPGDATDRILAEIAERDANVIGIVHTHGHFDHISATEAVLAGLPHPVPLWAHPADAYLYEPSARAIGAQYGYPQVAQPILPDHALSEDVEIPVGSCVLRVLHTPGHTPGSVTLVAGDTFALSGDTLFRRGIGRTDLLGGDEEAIYVSILSQLYPLPELMVVYPGHGPATTIGEERQANPYVRG